MPAPGASVDPLDDLVAAAGGRLETGAVEYADVAPAVADQLAPLQRAGGLGNGNPQHAQHVAEYLLRDTKIVGSHAVARHQEPAGEAAFDQVETVARGDLRDLGHPVVYIAVHLFMQGPGRAELFAEARR